jgi:hypothetical protein
MYNVVLLIHMKDYSTSLWRYNLETPDKQRPLPHVERLYFRNYV